MKSSIRLAVSVTALLSISAASALEPMEGEIINKATCTQGTESRELEIIAKGLGHAVNYTKNGATKEVGSCSKSKSKCQDIFDHLKATLEKQGYTCKT